MLGSCRVLSAKLGEDSATSCQDGAKTARKEHTIMARYVEERFEGYADT